MAKDQIFDALSGVVDNMKAVQESSMEALNTVITPDVEAILPDDVKVLLSKTRKSFSLKGTNTHAKMQDLNELSNNIHNLSKRYAPGNK